MLLLASKNRYVISETTRNTPGLRGPGTHLPSTWMSGEPPRINYIQSPLVPLNEFRNLVTDHLAILIEAEQEFPEHHATIANITHQFERHLSILVATVETYTTFTSTDIRGGRFSHYAVRKGRTTGIFNTWFECFNSTNGVPNQFRGFNSLHEAQQYLRLPA